MKVSLGIAWQRLRFEERLELVKQAENARLNSVFLDGDVSQLPRHPEYEVLHGWTLLSVLLASSERIGLGSIRLVEHWNAAQLAQATATLEQLFPGRQRFLISIGGQAADARFGYPTHSAGERIQKLDETLDVIRQLWRGDEVHFKGQFVSAQGARLHRPPVAGSIPITIAGQGRRLLEVVAKHADQWDINLPPVPTLVKKTADGLAQACDKWARNPEEIHRSMWIFVRTETKPAAALLAEYRELNPWFSHLPEATLQQAIITGNAGSCWQQIQDLSQQLGLDEVILDLSGADFTTAQRVIDDLAPFALRFDAHSHDD